MVIRALRDLQVRAAYVDAVATPPGGEGVRFLLVPIREAKARAQARPVGSASVSGPGACLFALEGGELLASSCAEVNPNGPAGGFVPLRRPGRTLVLGFMPEPDETLAFVNRRGGQAYLVGRGNVIAAVATDGSRVPGFPDGHPVVRELGSP